MAKRLSEPNIKITITKVVVPLGAISGMNIRNKATTMTASMEMNRDKVPTVVNIVSGVLL